MPWTPRLDLHIDINGRYGTYLMTGADDSSLLNSPPEIVTADNFLVRLHFWTRGINGEISAVEINAPSFVFSASPSNTDDLLFMASGFAPVSGEIGVFEGVLNANTPALIDHLDAVPSGPKIILGEVEITVGGQKRSLQFDLAARRQIYDGQDAPTALPDADGWLAARINQAWLISTLGLASHPDLATANAALPIGTPFFNTDLGRLDITTI